MRPLLLCFALSLLACNNGAAPSPNPAEPAGKAPEAAPTAGLPAGHPPMGGTAPTATGSAEAAPAEAPPMAVTGEVIETMDAGDFTYVLLRDGGTDRWVAGPKTAVTVGAKLTTSPGSTVSGFTSPSLGRTFDQLTMVQQLDASQGAPSTPAH